MSTKTVSLDETAYMRLKELKEENESFSDTVKRLASERPLSEIAGIWNDTELEDKVEKTRKELEKELDATAEELS